MELEQAIRSRRSVKKYKAGVTISDEQLRELFNDAKLAPSSFNIQHWHFIVVREQARKDVLMQCANGQPQVGACAAAVIVVADPEQYKKAGEYWRKSGVPDSVAERYEKMIPGFYKDDPQKARDESLRSVGLIAATLMLKAKAMGLETGPMIGFDAEAVSREFHIRQPRFPAMLIVMGEQDPEASAHERPYRRPVSDIVRLEDGEGKALSEK